MEQTASSSTHEVFHGAQRALGEADVCKIWGVSKRQYYRYSADPAYCAESTPDPLLKLQTMLAALKANGHEGLVDGCLGDLADRLGYDVTPRSAKPAKPAGMELLDVATALGRLSQCFADAMQDGMIDQEDRAAIKPALRALVREVLEMSAAIDAEGTA